MISLIILSQEKRIGKIYKKLVNSNSMPEETRRNVKTFQTNIIYFTNTYIQACKILSAYYRVINYQKYFVKDSFNFVTEIVDQDSSNFIGSLDIRVFST